MLKKSGQFECKQCGLCCQTKTICLYPFELKKLRKIAKELRIQFQVEPLRVILDKKHQKIIILVYTISERPCPFYLNKICLIQNNKPIACRKYPIHNWIDLGKTFKFLGLNKAFYDVDEKCTFIQTHPAFQKTLKNLPLSKILSHEYRAVLEDKKIWLSLNHQFNILKKDHIIKTINEQKLKNSNLEKYQAIIRSWEQISAPKFLEQIKKR